MGCDNIVSSTIVLADGRIVTASETENPNLSWAIKGKRSAGKSHSVVTDFHSERCILPIWRCHRLRIENIHRAGKDNK